MDACEDECSKSYSRLTFCMTDRLPKIYFLYSYIYAVDRECNRIDCDNLFASACFKTRCRSRYNGVVCEDIINSRPVIQVMGTTFLNLDLSLPRLFFYLTLCIHSYYYILRN